jgi:hypothetical protein
MNWVLFQLFNIIVAFISISQYATGSASNLWPNISGFFSYWSSDGRTFHFTLEIHNNTSIIYNKFLENKKTMNARLKEN